MLEYINKVICGDNIEVMAKMPDNCIDTIITDPPYGLGFMGKEWDTFNRDYLNKKRIADKKRKPRTDGRTVAAWNDGADAGSYDHSRNAEFQQWFTIWAKEVLRIAKPGATMLIFGGTRTYHRLTCAIEDAGWQIRDCMMWLYGSGFPKSLDISKAIDKATKPRKEFADQLCYSTSLSRRADMCRAKETATKYANLVDLWDGYGTALKPAWEPIVVAMKPLDGTFAENAEKWGVAGLNIDGGRIGTNEEIGRDNRNIKNSPLAPKDGWNKNSMKGLDSRGQAQGRWPANVILDETAAALLDEQSGVLKSGGGVKVGKRKKQSTNFTASKNYDGVNFNPDSGGASRFFYTAKASKAERNAGCEGLPEKENNTYSNFAGTTKHAPKLNVKKQNHHPTVKPLKLMEYLCELTKTPTGGVVLDPFGGSGTTAIACVNTGRDYILIEKDPEYCQIAEKRVKYWKEQKAGQQSLFEVTLQAGRKGK